MHENKLQIIQYINLRCLLRAYSVAGGGDTSVDKKANKLSKKLSESYVLVGWRWEERRRE